MTEEACVNCGEPAIDEFDLVLRGNDHEDVPLCERCHDALATELGEVL